MLEVPQRGSGAEVRGRGPAANTFLVYLEPYRIGNAADSCEYRLISIQQSLKIEHILRDKILKLYFGVLNNRH